MDDQVGIANWKAQRLFQSLQRHAEATVAWGIPKDNRFRPSIRRSRYLFIPIEGKFAANALHQWPDWRCG
jgi:hypothetical protein